jgi:hypothetical protein
MKDFFISYTKADREWADWIGSTLESNDFTVVLQAWDFLPGSNFILEMHRAIKETKRTITVLSQDYSNSLMTQPEWAATLFADPTGEKKRLVPVRVRDYKPDGLFAAISYIDIVGLSEAKAEQILIRSLTQKRLKPSHPPQFPGHSSSSSTQKFPGSLNKNPASTIPNKKNNHSNHSKWIPCSYCKGTGIEPLSFGTTCPVCHGARKNKITFSNKLEPMSCAFCNRTGTEEFSFGKICGICKGIGVNLVKKPAKRCNECNGSGKEKFSFGMPCNKCQGTGYK